MSAGILTRERRKSLERRIRWIVAATIAYNVVEAIVAITAGTIASSGALIAFGLDSTIEVLSAAAVAWQFTRRDPERWERPTLRVIAVFAGREGREAWRGDACATSVGMLLEDADDHHRG